MGRPWYQGELRITGVSKWCPTIASDADTLRYIATDINKDVRTQPEHKAVFDIINSRIPMGRWGDADDFKGVAVFMASPASAYMSGENIVIDGGWMAR